MESQRVRQALELHVMSSGWLGGWQSVRSRSATATSSQEKVWPTKTLKGSECGSSTGEKSGLRVTTTSVYREVGVG
jgi:hypothetical protein